MHLNMNINDDVAAVIQESNSIFNEIDSLGPPDITEYVYGISFYPRDIANCSSRSRNSYIPSPVFCYFIDRYFRRVYTVFKL